MNLVSGGTLSRPLAHASAVLGVAFWGTMIPAIDVLLPSVDPYTLSAIRYAICVSLILPWLLARHGLAWMVALPWGRILLLGGAMAAFTTIYTLGIAFSNPVSAVVVGGTSPLISVLFAAVVYRVGIRRGTGVAFLLAAIGAVTASLGGRRFDGGLGFRGGEILIVTAAAVWSWYSMQAQRWLGDLGQLRATGLAILAAALWLLIILAGAAASGVELRLHWSMPAAIALLWVTFAVTLAGILLWNRSVAQLGIVMATLYLNFMPIFGILAAAVLGRYPTWWQILGGGLVVLGVLQLQYRRS